MPCPGGYDAPVVFWSVKLKEDGSKHWLQEDWQPPAEDPDPKEVLGEGHGSNEDYSSSRYE